MIKPLGRRIIVKRDPTKTETESGFIIVKEAQKPELSGTALAIGPDVKDVKVGDRVIFGRIDGTPLPEKYAEENCIILNEEQIKGVYV